MRVIAGKYRSRILKTPKSLELRPTSDRLRETLFNVLGAGVADSRFIDLFAGTGAIGIEALSRGAAEVVLVENHAPAARLIRRNLESLGVQFGVSVVTADALRALEKLASEDHGEARGYDFLGFGESPGCWRDGRCRASAQFRIARASRSLAALPRPETRRRGPELLPPGGCNRR